jgi:hypothetical protein
MKTPVVLILVSLGLSLCGWGVFDHVRSRHARELQQTRAAMHREVQLISMQQNLQTASQGLNRMDAGLDQIREASSKLKAIADIERSLLQQQAEAERQRQSALYEASLRRQQAELSADFEKRLGIGETGK